MAEIPKQQSDGGKRPKNREQQPATNHSTQEATAVPPTSAAGPASSAPLAASAPTHLESVFPDVTTFFVQRPSLEEIAKNAAFVFDANSLLEPYRYSQKTFQELATKLRQLGKLKRLYVPEHALREFVKHRSAYMRDCIATLKQRQGSIQVGDPVKAPMFDHNVYAEFVGAATKLRDSISDTIRRLEGWYYDDPVSALYAELFQQGAIVKPDENAAKIAEELKRRNDNNIPPGYLDAEKQVNAEGDLIIWLTIKKLGKDCSVVFVSNDGKPDWAVCFDGKGLFPRFELVDEFRRETGRDFHLVTLPRFLQLFQATPDSVAEARSTIKSGAWENVVRALAALPPGGASAAAELVSIPYALRHMSWHRPKRSSVLDELSAALDDVVGEAAVIAATGQLPDTNALFRMVERAASSAGDVALPTGEAELVGSFVNDARKLHSLVAIIVNAAGLDDESKAAYRTSARQLSGQLIGYRQQMKLV